MTCSPPPKALEWAYDWVQQQRQAARDGGLKDLPGAGRTLEPSRKAWGGARASGPRVTSIFLGVWRAAVL